MKNLLIIILISTVTINIQAQTFSTNDTPVGMEHNVLFNATTNFKVSQTGSAALNINALFDGKFAPSYTATAPTPNDPTVVLIENLPEVHAQRGVWIGWSTRYWQATRFKIEALNVHKAEEWITVADYTNEDYTGGANFNTKVQRGSFAKLRFTFYAASGTDGRMGVSELFYIHPEAVTPYQNLIQSAVNNEVETNAPAITTNISPTGLEHNLLFNATKQFTVSQTGSAGLILNRLFDGKFAPSYTNAAPSFSDPTVVLIEDLPNVHIQRGAWIGWSTRGRAPVRFKIEGYNTYENANQVEGWITMADYSGEDYTGGIYFNLKVPSGRYTKLRFSFYTTNDANGWLGISELFYLHPEAVSPYEGLLKSGLWSKENDDLIYNGGNVGIGSSPAAGWKLSVNGKIRAKEVKVETGWADFVFEKDYELPSLSEVEAHIKSKGHLQDIPTAKEVAENGINLGEIQARLLQKIEELTLYTIEQEKQLNQQQKLIELQTVEIDLFKNAMIELQQIKVELMKLKK